ncbi:trypsin-like [Condylostylus longicornis]|uniref:trypsin-like n=1 Tax=Condylostylus longicornis TaxID=2530218 RepID=UPI00244E1BD8|nr:trypsin-like [Condylostylus longicornis]
MEWEIKKRFNNSEFTTGTNTNALFIKSVKLLILALVLLLKLAMLNFKRSFDVDAANYIDELLSNKSFIDIKIVGGKAANIKNHPHQVSVQENGFGHFCGGSLITRKWVLTAAHCFYGSKTPISKYFIRAGSTFHNKGGVIGFPLKIYIAKKYNPRTNDWDISLIKLKNRFSKKLTSQYPIQRITLRKTLPPSKTYLTVTGWGAMRAGAVMLPTQLRKTRVPLISFQYCNRKTNNAGMITKRQFCAGFKQGGKDSCQGDSGGPITIRNRLVGIVSWGLGCAFRNSPGVYTKLPAFLKYIKKLVRNG